MIKIDSSDRLTINWWGEVDCWLREHVGKSGVDWSIKILDMRSDQLTFKREADETAFRLRWM